MLRLLAIAIATPVLYLLGFQSKLIYYPRDYQAGHLQMLDAAGGARLSFTTSQGAQTAFYIPPRMGDSELPEVVWVCFSGNAALALEWLHFTPRWDERFAYLLVDYPGYGDCAGKPNPESIRESGKASVAALAHHLNTTPQELQPRLAVLGHSIGAAAALMAAEDHEIRRAVLLSPFTTMTDMARIVVGWPLCPLNLHRFDNRKTLGRVAAREGARIVLFHGAEDEAIPVRMGRELARLHPQAVTYHEIPGAHHNDMLDLISKRIGDAMREVAGLSAR